MRRAGRGPACPRVTDPLDEVFRSEAGRCTATLIRVFGDIDLAEDAVAEAFAIAAEGWPKIGIPPNPGGWITTTARNRAIDRLRRESSRSERHLASHRLHTESMEPDHKPELDRLDDFVDVVADDQLRLMFLCAHPALAADTQVALILRLLGGLETSEIAKAFVVPEATMAQRIVRAKRKLHDNHASYRIPRAAELPDRLAAVLAAIYLIYTEGHTATSGRALMRTDLSSEAVRLGRTLAELMPDESEAIGLLALMLLTESRRPARMAADGTMVRLADQDRTRWDRDLISEGHELVRACLRRNQPGPFQIQAAIAAVYADAPRPRPQTGLRSSPSTTGSPYSVPTRWLLSTDRWPSQSFTDLPEGWPLWPRSTRRLSTTTSPTMLLALTCSPAPATSRRRWLPTSEPSNSPRTRSNATFSFGSGPPSERTVILEVRWRPNQRGGTRGRVSRKGRSPAGHSCKHQVPAGGDLVGVFRLVVVDWLVANRTSAFRRLPEASTAISGPVMSAGSPRNVILAKRTRAPSAAHGESQPIGRGPVRRRASTGLPERVFTCLYREGRRGIVREPEGVETPPPGKSSERPRSKHREPDIRNVEAEGSSPFTSTKSPGQRAEVDPPKVEIL